VLVLADLRVHGRDGAHVELAEHGYAEYRLRIGAPGRMQLAEVELLAPGQ